jgi:uncharacterized protein (DUF1697 family)
MTQYVALLRGINVGGNNMISMKALAACFEKQGLRDVSTYIQSGNALFAAPAAGRAQLTRRIEKVLSSTFAYRACVVLRTLAEMRDTVQRAPDGFGTAPDVYRYDVIFLKEPLTAAAAIDSVATRQGVDDTHAGPGALYFRRLVSKAAQSQLAKIGSSPIYKEITIRNWNTTTKLLALLEARER